MDKKYERKTEKLKEGKMDKIIKKTGKSERKTDERK